jgi:hypothetical protein
VGSPLAIETVIGFDFLQDIILNICNVQMIADVTQELLS